MANAGEVLSERRFPGYLKWLGFFYVAACSVVVFSPWAYPRTDGHLPDLTRVMVIWPLEALLFAGLAALALVLVLRISFKAALQALTAWWWILWIPTVVDWPLRLVGVSAERPLELAWQVLVGFVTAGFFPQPLAGVGTLIALLALAFLVFRTVSSITKNLRQSIFAALLVYLPGMLLLAAPSLLARLGIMNGGSYLFLGALGLRRGLILLCNSGYWSNAVFDRFPLALGGESEVSVEYFLGGLAYVALALPVIALIFKTLSPQIKRWWQILRARDFSLAFSLVFFGAAWALAQGSRLTLNFSSVVALFVFALVIFSAWMFATVQNDLSDVAADELQAPEKPLISGALKFDDLREVNGLFLVLALAGAWLLGWPIFFCLASCVILRTIYDGLPFRAKDFFPAKYLVLGAADLSLILVGWFFLGQHADPSRFGGGLAFGLVLGLAGLSVVKNFKDQASLNQRTWQNRALVGTAVLAYLVLPVFSGWWRWFVLALPFAAATAFFASTRPYNERWPRLLIRLFFLLSGLLLAAGWLVVR